MRHISPLFCSLGLVSLASPALAQWSTESLSVSRTNVATVTAGDLVLFAGGRIGSAVQDVLDIYDASTGTWTATTLPAPRANLAATTMGDLVFFAGGVGPGFTVSDAVDILDTQNMTWSSATLSQARAIVGMTTVGNKVLVAGGGGIGWVSDVVDVYDASLGAPNDPLAWSVGTQLSTPRSHTSAVMVGDRAIFAGGAGASGTPFATVDIYDDLSQTWSTATLSVARLVGNASTVVGDRAYFAGGHFSASGGPNMSDALDVYHAQGDHWTSTVLPSGPRGYVGVTAVGNTVIFGGGVESGFVASDLVERLNVGTGLWDTPQQLSQAGARAAAAVGRVALFADNGTAVVDVYEPVGVNYCGAEENSTGSAATISATGTNSVAANDLTLIATQLPPNQFGLFVNSMTPGFVAHPGGSQGNLCLGGSIGRYNQGVFSSGPSGMTSFLLDLANTPSAAGFVPITVGETWNFQCWFRDVNPGPTSNFTDAVSVTFR